MKSIFGACLSLAGGLAGFLLFSSQFQSQEQKRSLASVKSQYDLTCLEGESFEKAYKARLISGFKSFRKDGNLGLEIGHFIFSPKGTASTTECKAKLERNISSAFSARNPTQKMLCTDYPKIKISFVANDGAISGEKKRFEILADCQVSSDLSKTEAIWIPWEKLSQETPFEGEAQFNQPSKVSVKTVHVSDQWPQKWSLDSIQLEGSAGQLTITQDEIRTIAGRPIIFDFP